MPVIVDMGGYAEDGAIELFKKADLVLCPIKLNSFGIVRAFESIEAISDYSDNIVVIHTFSKSTLTHTPDLDAIKERLSHIHIKKFFEIKENNVFSDAQSKKIGVTELWRGENEAKAGTYGHKKGMKTPNIKEQIELLETFIKEI